MKLRLFPVTLGVMLLCILGGGAIVFSSGTTNLLVNGDFSAGFASAPGVNGVVATGWTAFADPAQGQPTMSAGSVAGNSGQAVGGAGSLRAGVFQVVNGLTPGQRYEFCASAYPPLQDGAVRFIGVSPLGHTDPFSGSAIIGWSTAGMLGIRQHLTLTFTATMETASVFLRVDRETGSSEVTVFDDAVLSPAGGCTFPQYRSVALPRIDFHIPPPTPTPTPSGTATSTPTITPSPTSTSSPTITSTPSSVPTLLWDENLTSLNVHVEWRDGDYRLIAAWITINGSWDSGTTWDGKPWNGVPAWARRWQRDTLGGDHHAFGRAEDAAGQPQNLRYFLLWPGESAERRPEPDGWANIPLYAGYDPRLGPGPYTWYVEGGDQLVGLGLPFNHHYSFFGVWVEKEAAAAALATASVPVTPTCTPAPPPGTATFEPLPGSAGAMATPAGSSIRDR